MPVPAVVSKDVAADTLSDLLDSFALSVRAAGRSPATARLHVAAMRGFIKWLDATERSTVAAQVTPDDVRAYLLARGDAGWAGNTILADHRGCRAFWRWAASEGVVPTDITDRVRGPKVDQPIMPVFSDDDLRALFRACDGPTFLDRRDAAILRLLADTGIRRAELVSLTTADLDLAARVAIIRRGKGGRGRVVAFSDKTALALDRYLRARRAHKHVALDALWLTRTGPLTFAALRDALHKRARRAGVEGAHPHAFRHAWAHRALAAGAGELDVMTLGGWSSLKLLQQVYGVALKGERAVATARRIALGDNL